MPPVLQHLECDLKPQKDPSQRDRWARLRFSIIGPLLAAPPGAGELQDALALLGAKTWRHPTSGLDATFGISTLQRWYYAARHAPDPVAALKNRLRAGVRRFPSLSQTVIDTLTQQYREHPGWTAQLHFDNLCAALKGTDTTLASYPTVRRYLKAQGMFRQARPKRATAGALAARDRLERLEVRSFEVDHVNALWHLDFHHGSRKVLTRQGQWITPMIMCVLDDRSRLVCHLQWYLDETAQSLIHCLCQAFMKRGLPRALMTDNGAAMMAEETTTGLAALGIVHQPTLPYSPYQNAKQESFWGRIEGRLMALLEGDASLNLDALNLATQAWTEQEYHRTLHSEINATPLVHYLAGPNVARPCPDQAVLTNSFSIEVARRQRRSDGTVSVVGTRFEIPSRYRHLEHVNLRYARWDLSRVDLVDARTGAVLCAVKPLDKSANANGQRRTLSPAALDLTPMPPKSMPALMTQLLADYAATGLPPAYLPVSEPVIGVDASTPGTPCTPTPTSADEA
jgi:transposase InsO family protein